MKKTRVQYGGGQKFLLFWCPGCEDVHSCRVRDGQARPSWEWNGDRDTPTLNPSVLCTTNNPSHPGYQPDAGTSRPRCRACGKTAYPSEAAARAANKSARFRWRIYFCPKGRSWHVMNRDKR